MTKIKILLGTLVLALAACGPASGQVGYQSAMSASHWSGKGKNLNTNASYFITSARGMPICVQAVNAESDAALAVLRFYSAGSPVTVTEALATSLSNIVVDVPSTFSAGDLIAIRSVANDTYQLTSVHTATATSILITNVITTPVSSALTDFALSSGDKVYKLTLAGSMHVGLRTNLFNPVGGLWNSEDGKPGVVVLIQNGGISTNTAITYITGTTHDRR